MSGTSKGRKRFTGLEGPFDYIVLSDTIGMLDDIESALWPAASGCAAVDPRHHRLLLPLVGADPELVEWLGLRMPQPPLNYLVNNDFLNIIDLADFEPIKAEYRQLVPRKLFGLGTFINKFIAPMPGIRRLCLRNYFVVRSLKAKAAHRHVGQRHHPLPQRARQYRNRDHAHAGVRARAGNRLYRRQFHPTAPTRNACA